MIVSDRAPRSLFHGAVEFMRGNPEVHHLFAWFHRHPQKTVEITVNKHLYMYSSRMVALVDGGRGCDSSNFAPLFQIFSTKIPTHAKSYVESLLEKHDSFTL